MSPIEFWKPVNGYPPYQVSNIGRIRKRESSGGWRPVQQTLENGADHYVHLWVDGVHNCRLVCRIVLSNFSVEGDAGPDFTVAHRNYIKADNRLVNLVWVQRAVDCSNDTRVRRYLTTADHSAIFNRLKNGEKHIALANEYGITVGYLYHRFPLHLIREQNG